MATKKDLVEAYSFSRRRLVTAFVSGAPGGREVEPARPGRALIGGVALTILLLAGGAIAGIFTDQPGSDWKEPGLVRSEADGQNYIIFEDAEADGGELRPVLNFASARLILGEATEEVDTVPESELTSVRRGPPIGILGAPSPVPGVDDLIQSGWTACTDDGAGIRVDLNRSARTEPVPSGGLLVRSEGSFHLIAEAQEVLDDDTLGPRRAYSYELGDPDAGLLADLRITTAAKEVPASWLRLFPTGGPLDASSIPIPGAGTPYRGAGADDLPQDARIGDYYSTGDLTLVLTEDGVARLTEFAQFVYLDTAPRGRTPRELPIGQTPDIDFVEAPYRAARWPESSLEPVTGNYCAMVEPSAEEVPVVRLVADPTEDAAVPPDLDPAVREPVVESGFGAFVLSGGFDNPGRGEPHLIDDRGFHYPVVGPQAVANLGFAEVAAPVIPDSWLKLFQPGVALSVDAALCPPARDPEAATCDQ